MTRPYVRRDNLSKEEKKAEIREYARNYRNNLSPEKKAARAAKRAVYSKRYRENRDPEARRISSRKYYATENGKQRILANLRTYHQTAKGKACLRRGHVRYAAKLNTQASNSEDVS